MAGDRASRSGAPALVIQKVVPVIPTDQAELQRLEFHLDEMACRGLLEVAWGSREETFVRELGAPVAILWISIPSDCT